MFGMLDYRAYKLLWLLTRPFVIVSYLILVLCLVLGIFVAERFHYPAPVKIFIAYVAFEAIGFFAFLFSKLVLWLIERAFFWAIDVVPAEGRDREMAMQVARLGPIVPLAQKFENRIEDWTFEDTLAAKRLMLNWRSRLFFDGTERLEKRAHILQQHHLETGQEPSQLSQGKIEELVGHLNARWIEKLIVYPQSFRSLVAFTVICWYFIEAAPH